jgi:hypothetical protein
VPCFTATVATPGTLRSLSSGTFRGPGEGAVPGAGCAPAGLTATAFAALPYSWAEQEQRISIRPHQRSADRAVDRGGCDADGEIVDAQGARGRSPPILMRPIVMRNGKNSGSRPTITSTLRAARARPGQGGGKGVGTRPTPAAGTGPYKNSRVSHDGIRIGSQRAPVQRIALIVGRSLDFNSANDRNATVGSCIL